MIFINAQRECAEIQMRICQYHRPESRASLTDVRLSLTESSKSLASIKSLVSTKESNKVGLACIKGECKPFLTNCGAIIWLLVSSKADYEYSFERIISIRSM